MDNNLEKVIEEIRKDFPILKTKKDGKSLAYLDNGATTQKPKIVADRLYKFYTEEYATIHRGVYNLSQKATQYVNEAREIVRSFINASSTKEIIFTRGTTESINLVANSYGNKFLQENDEIVISGLEHHANIVPWQEVSKRTGAKLRVLPINQKGEVEIQDVNEYITANTKLIAITHVSNALGTINPIELIIKEGRKVGAKILIDGAQAVSHKAVDVQTLDCDFYTFSSHKLFGPSGIGVLFGKKDILESMSVYQTGGDMIETVTFEKTTYSGLPEKFEAGTPAIAEIIGLGEAIKYMNSIGFDVIKKIEKMILDYANYKLEKIDRLKVIGTANKKASVISFIIEGIHPHDIGTVLDEDNVAIRAGHHCAQPIMKFLNIPATSRASMTFYNNKKDIDQFVKSLESLKHLF